CLRAYFYANRHLLLLLLLALLCWNDRRDQCQTARPATPNSAASPDTVAPPCFVEVILNCGTALCVVTRHILEEETPSTPPSLTLRRAEQQRRPQFQSALNAGFHPLAGPPAGNVFRPAASYQGPGGGAQSSSGKVGHWA